MAGHDHHYERIMRDNLVYFVNGLGGAARYEMGNKVSGSELRYNAKHGAMLIEATETDIVFQFINIDGKIVDTYHQSKSCQ
jgi:hypothetical protein